MSCWACWCAFQCTLDIWGPCQLTPSLVECLAPTCGIKHPRVKHWLDLSGHVQDSVYIGDVSYVEGSNCFVIVMVSWGSKDISCNFPGFKESLSLTFVACIILASIVTCNSSIENCTAQSTNLGVCICYCFSLCPFQVCSCLCACWCCRPTFWITTGWLHIIWQFMRLWMHVTRKWQCYG